MSHLDELRARDIRLKQSLGQNLLVDPNLCRKLVQSVPVKPGDAVLEIGPGTGALTEELLAAGAQVAAVETDGRLIPLLTERFGPTGAFTLFEADILRWPREAFDAWRAGRRVHVASNLPYYNASQVLFQLLEWRDAFGAAVLTLQKEMADRVCAEPNNKDYGVLSVRAQALTRAERLFLLPASAFFPRPKVDSRAIRLDFGACALPPDLPERAFARCVKGAFSARRKTLSNSLANAYSKPEVAAGLAAAGIDPRARAESLSVRQFFSLTAALVSAQASSPPAARETEPTPRTDEAMKKNESETPAKGKTS